MTALDQAIAWAVQGSTRSVRLDNYPGEYQVTLSVYRTGGLCKVATGYGESLELAAREAIAVAQERGIYNAAPYLELVATRAETGPCSANTAWSFGLASGTSVPNAPTASPERCVDRVGVGVVPLGCRDHSHAIWDSEQLGGIPIYAVAAGRAMLVAPKKREEG